MLIVLAVSVAAMIVVLAVLAISCLRLFVPFTLLPLLHTWETPHGRGFFLFFFV